MTVSVVQVKEQIAAMCRIIIGNEVHFCELDSAAGDGDFGMSLAKGFKEVQRQIDTLDQDDPHQFLRSCSMVIMEFCGGASGPIWGSAFAGAARAAKGKGALDPADIVLMFQEAIAGIQKRGGAKLGDKTLLDALIPATDALKSAVAAGDGLDAAFAAAAAAAQEGADKTRNMVASKGRASYVGERSLEYPDAGAMAVAIILQSLVN